MATTDTENVIEIVELLRQLPEPALDEVKIFLNSLLDRYQQTSISDRSQNRGETIIAALAGKATSSFTTDEIMSITRGEE
jgi:hypothetical protein